MSEVSEVSEVQSQSLQDAPDPELSSELDKNYDKHVSDARTSDAPEMDETKAPESGKEEDLDKELDEKYEKNVNAKDDADVNDAEHIKCRNESLAGEKHPESGVPFETRTIEYDGKNYEVTVPKFESKFDAQLPEDMYQSKDSKQFKECDLQLRDAVNKDPELKAQFNKEQLEMIEAGKTPRGYTWHHDAEPGRMQLVDTEIHKATGHTGGRNIWGGGTENR